MLPAAARLRRRQEFTDVVRRGRRTSRGPLTLHLTLPDLPVVGAPAPALVLTPASALAPAPGSAPASRRPAPTTSGPASPPAPGPAVTPAPPNAAVTPVPPSTQVGFVIGKVVGPAVVRNRLRRRLRHVLRSRLVALPVGSRLVVRARPGAGELDSAALAALLDAALPRLVNAA